MAYKCDNCGKGIQVGRNVSHAKNRTRRLSFPNLHKFKGILNGKKGKWLLCTKCLRKVKAVQKKKEEKTPEKKITKGKKEETT